MPVRVLPSPPANVHKVQGAYEGREGEFDFFIGHIVSGQEYHLLGFRPRKIAYLFSEASESRTDHGTVSLPRGKSTLRELVNGDLLSIAPSDETVKPYGLVFHQFGH